MFTEYFNLCPSRSRATVTFRELKIYFALLMSREREKTKVAKKKKPDVSNFTN